MFKTSKKLDDLEKRIEKLEKMDDRVKKLEQYWQSWEEELKNKVEIQKYARSEEAYQDAKKLVIETNNPSATLLKNKLEISYVQAASLIDKLEDNGVISPMNDVGSRYIVGF